MANLCFNKLIIRGEHKEIERFLGTVAGEDTLFDFNKILPVPEELYKVLNVGTLDSDMLNTALEAQGYTLPDEVTKHLDTNLPEGEGTFRDNAVMAIECTNKYDYPCWVHWCVKNWGVRKNARDTKIRWRKPCCCYLSFTTDWEPPRGVMRVAGPMFPKLTFILKHKQEVPKPGPNSIFLGNGEFINVKTADGSTLTEEDKEEIKKIYLSKDPSVCCTFDRSPK